MHYLRWWRNGDPNNLERFRSPEESFSNRTRREGDCLIWTGAKTTDGYGSISINRKPYLAHRYAWEQQNGEVPDGMQVHHLCYDRSCVEIEHLTLVTQAQNSSARRGPMERSQSGVRNVYFQDGRWRVRVRAGGQTHSFGMYQSIEEASKVAEQARRELFGEFAGRG